MKNEVLFMYFNEGMSVSNIAKTLGKSRTNIYSILKENERYESESKIRRKNKKTKIEERQEKIREMFYKKNMKVLEIANILNISNALVTRTIKADSDYKNEKLRRKEENIKINKERKKIAIRRKRSVNKEEEMKVLLMLQRQNAISMSRRTKLSNRRMIIMNLNHYNYNPLNESLEFVENCGSKPNDLPTKINLHGR
ncbi:transposase [Clostridium acetobutylicum]|uniref:Uncharacterized protein n=1 Tax=Clostridium acetobutylicum (strain ATCC 824 / DSM 792 / JCM 1419 / IAM 19013 / LMG 5710 / NBRC 13948 / NRRL B-527 / VKM B-1787 / 2291 / W) TaxID=272562 RepID=Q97HF8_CLOAB|nr:MULTISPECIES: helix-turn-helix domain-containing protein [Clostridium]AAK80012.1 Hypothetical protein CA_C2053 [Clostridium acetobutylicum ATCC 824]ADZ21104.1 Conserved hypothetical protein [Clostridium acetobutylicum EA 2018]AEI32159.1 hypothetical protein SMB_G2086 [Clostridium acetobutylicum DSM 1731]AWV79559.1 helix-turn-helix domain-containing protein [Clostridium acetobutylicum]MBC2394467.1 helix-turn-helix domain-containing protein [Clostridium acetobutylicum]